MCNATYDWGGNQPLECHLDEHSTTLLNDTVHVGKLWGKEFYWNDRDPYGTPDPNAVMRKITGFTYPPKEEVSEDK